jgi:hypothetical protein
MERLLVALERLLGLERLLLLLLVSASALLGMERLLLGEL